MDFLYNFILITALSLGWPVQEQSSASVKNLTLYGKIDYNDQSATLIKALYSAKEGEHINIYISSEGGLVVVKDEIFKALHVTRATVSTIVVRYANSAAGLIAMYNPKGLILTSEDTIGVHFAVVKGKMITPKSKYWDNSIARTNGEVLTLYAGILTKSEILHIINGGSVYLSAKRISDGLCKVRQICGTLKNG